MRLVPKTRREWSRELLVCPEAYSLFLLILIVWLLGHRLSAAVLWFQIWGASTAIGAFWALVVPRYVQKASAWDLAVKSIFVLIVGGGLIFAHWVYGVFAGVARTFEAGEIQRVPVPLWVWAFGTTVGVAGVVGLILCKRLSRAIERTSLVTLRAVAALVLVAAVLFLVRWTMAGVVITCKAQTADNSAFTASATKASAEAPLGLREAAER